MTAHTSFIRPTSRRASRAILVLLAAGLAAGCNRTDPNQKAIDAASVKLETFAAPGSVPHPTEKIRKDAYTSVLTGLKSVAETGTPGQQSAANLLIARGQAGVGEIAAQNAAELERRFMTELSLSLGALDQWVSQNSVADALKVYDPAKDIADLDKQIADRLAEAEKLQSERTQQETVVAGIKARSDKAAGEAKSLRQQEAALRKQTEGQTQTAKLDTITQVNQIRRSADKLDEQAAMLQAEAAKESPRLDELQREIDRLRTQSDLLRKAKSEIQDRASKSIEQSDVARKEAEIAAAKIKTAMTNLATQRSAISGPMQEAIRAYTQATTAAKKSGQGATGQAKTGSQLSAGSYQQSLGDVHATQAFSMAAYAATLKTIAAAKPSVPGLSTLDADIQAAMKDLETAKAEAKTAYENALNMLTSGGKAEDPRVIQIKAAMDTLLNIKPVAPPAAEPGAEPKPGENAPAPDGATPPPSDAPAPDSGNAPPATPPSDTPPPAAPPAPTPPAGGG